jgi:Xaa-Pro dipeptidase
VLLDYQRLSRFMEAADVDVILTSSRMNNGYVTDLRRLDYSHYHNSSEYYLYFRPKARRGTVTILPRDRSKGASLVLPASEWSGMHFGGSLYDGADTWIEDKRWWGSSYYTIEKGPEDGAESPFQTAAKVLIEKGLDRGVIAVEMRDISAMDYERLKSMLPAARFVDADPILWQMRMIKSPEEVGRMKAASERVCRSIEAAFGSLREGVTVDEVTKVIRRCWLEDDLRDAFTKVVFGVQGGGDGSTPKTLRSGTLVRLEGGASYMGYLSYVTRVVAFGEVDESAQRAHATVLKMRDVLFDACRAGARCSDLFELHERIAVDAGYKPFLIHTAAASGRGLAEPPLLTKDEDTVLEEGMVIGLEPGIRIYYPGGTWLNDVVEDIVVVRNGPPENLTPLGAGLDLR